ncbi:CPA_1a_G0017770.mRNA.1.CDS.1 [Saccharomyces cerevisiae]|nr:CPA_1a_G0006490.mRNA.1.CDS.1 [Saccharomyces cerevisiae]CAI4442710.1 CPA_1a_G0017770.mRNA.1.CDS.1 [Saccharomyces cerevisiae]CAI4535943.1 BBM_1a_G0027600.mRNA.1.CDS.1 [Saccharomyces cerevisiae]CAI4561277.1 CPI_1c_G0030800.mRNA.1.CDS.1 [Saccharomyces cerevisiae]CAI7161837.1 BBM_1a_G0027600.mRNA.1.CDS.1 [Saccharomyces cerevisiae]
MEIAGYIARCVSSSNRQELAPYIVQSVLLLIAPSFIAASIYMIFGRLLHLMRCQSLMMISPRFGTTFFVVGDVFSFVLQAAGGGLMSQEATTKTGSHLATAGLFIQVVFFGFFIINEVRFTVNAKKRCIIYQNISKKWSFVNAALLLSSALIFVRSIVRIVEFIEGFNGYIMGHEFFIYVFDALLMLLVVVTFNVSFFLGNIFDVITECQTPNIS